MACPDEHRRRQSTVRGHRQTGQSPPESGETVANSNEARSTIGRETGAVSFPSPPTRVTEETSPVIESVDDDDDADDEEEPPEGNGASSPPNGREICALEFESEDGEVELSTRDFDIFLQK